MKIETLFVLACLLLSAKADDDVPVSHVVHHSPYYAGFPGMMGGWGGMLHMPPLVPPPPPTFATGHMPVQTTYNVIHYPTHVSTPWNLHSYPHIFNPYHGHLHPFHPLHPMSMGMMNPMMMGMMNPMMMMGMMNPMMMGMMNPMMMGMMNPFMLMNPMMMGMMNPMMMMNPHMLGMGLFGGSLKQAGENEDGLNRKLENERPERFLASWKKRVGDKIFNEELNKIDKEIEKQGFKLK